ncbi:MAG: sigma 54-interacting transcriptional regulator [Bacillota bacterium]
MRLEDMMTRDFATLQPHDTLAKAVRLLRNSRRDGLPVLNGDGSLAGIFSKTNLYDALLQEQCLTETVDPFYNRNVVKISKDLSYSEVIDAVHKMPVGTGVVVDAAGAVVGLFTKVELITALFKEERLLNARLRAMYQAMHNGLVSVDLHGRVNFINRAAEQLLGLEHRLMQSRPLEQVLPRLNMRHVLEEGVIEVGVQYSLNQATTVVNKTPLIDGGRVVGGIAIFQDVTELELVAQELGSVKRLNQTLKTVLDIAYDAIVVVDEGGAVVLTNRSFLDFLRLKEDAVLHKPISDILENSRLPVVVKTGIPELNDIQFIEGKPYVVSRLPIVREGHVIGAVGKISFRRVDELRELAGRLEAMNSRLEHFQEELKKARYREQPYTFSDIISISPVMERLKREAEQAAQGLSTVLISGESGVGKELFAQAVHQAGPRRDGPFVKVNCAAVPENLLESEFFGYDPGAFTGAQKEGKRGRFELADGGTLFLDEIGDMPLALQAKLLRVLQDHAFERIGATGTLRIDIRVIAATNQDLERKVREGGFRKDLYFRLNVITIPIPPLRERPEDIPPLVHAFLRKYNTIFGMSVTDISPEALQLLLDYQWPGNVRELENIVERAMNFTSETIIQVEHLPPYLQQGRARGTATGLPPRSTGGSVYRWKREEVEREAIIKALQSTGGNKTRAARLLGMSRSWLYEKMDRMKIKDS